MPGAAAQGSNQVVLAHELLHTLGATDKYDPATGQPLTPAGSAIRTVEPPVSAGDWRNRWQDASRPAPNDAEIPDRLDQMVVGPLTAREIGWTK